jgi:hypothetical protein
MSKEDERVGSLISELSIIEFENGQLLDDESLRLVAEVRSRNLITADEWTQIKQLLSDALRFLSGEQDKAGSTPNGPIILDDSDPHNADWLRSYSACRLAGHTLPDWAALWLWRLRTDTSPAFWRKVGRIAERLGYPKFRSAVVAEGSKKDVSGFVFLGGNVYEQWKSSALTTLLATLRQDELPLGDLSTVEQNWLTTAFTHLIQIDQSRRVENAFGSAYCIFEVGLAYFQCLAPSFGTYLRCEAASEKFVPELAAILTREKKDRLVHEFGFAAPGYSKNFSQKIEIKGKDDLAYVARMAFRVLRDIYNVKDFGAAKFKVSIPKLALPIPEPVSSALPKPAEPLAEKPYVVFVDDNFHYMDEEERYKSGDYATLEEAVSKCRRIVDDFLEGEHKPGSRINYTIDTVPLGKIHLSAVRDPISPRGITRGSAVTNSVATRTTIIHDHM